MKKITILLIITFGFTFQLNAQCTSNASGFGNNTSVPMYNVTGTNSVQVVLNANNTVTVNLMSNFATASGPDVRIFLVDRGTLTTAQLRMTSNFLTRPRIEMGLSPASGMASFTKTIPAGTAISDFNTVYFYCQAFNQFWDFGSYTHFTAVSCALLGIDNFENDKLQLYPNPATNELNIALDTVTTNYSVAIYNTLGSLVFESKNRLSDDNSININNLNSGVYFVQITDDENKVYQKRLIKK